MYAPVSPINLERTRQYPKIKYISSRTWGIIAGALLYIPIGLLYSLTYPHVETVFFPTIFYILYILFGVACVEVFCHEILLKRIGKKLRFISGLFFGLSAYIIGLHLIIYQLYFLPLAGLIGLICIVFFNEVVRRGKVYRDDTQMNMGRAVNLGIALSLILFALFVGGDFYYFFFFFILCVITFLVGGILGGWIARRKHPQLRVGSCLKTGVIIGTISWFLIYFPIVIGISVYGGWGWVLVDVLVSLLCCVLPSLLGGLLGYGIAVVGESFKNVPGIYVPFPYQQPLPPPPVYVPVIGQSIPQASAIYNEAGYNTMTSIENEINTINQEMGELNGRIINAEKQFKDGKIDEAVFTRFKEKQLSSLQRLRERKGALEAQLLELKISEKGGIR